MPNGATYAAHAFAFASRLPLSQVSDWFAGEPTFRRSKTHVVATWGDDETAIAFDFGAVVFLNAPAATRKDTMERFSLGLPNEPHPPLREEMLVEVRRGARVEVGFDRVRVPVMTPAVCEVLATVIAQSVSLDYYDEDIQSTLDRIHSIATDIAQTGSAPRSKGEIVKFVGASVASQIEIISSLSLLDKPDLTWDDALADELHDKLRASFEIGERYRALETKISASRESYSAFLEMMQSRRSMLLEITVIVLIFVEIVLGVLKVV